MLEVIERLLILQDRDRKIRRLSGELAHIDPERRSFVQKGMATQVALEQAKTRVKQIESDRKQLELEVESKKQSIARYANQQLQTRKNEEYRALAHEIDTCQQQIFEIENKEIELMEQAEAAQREVAQAGQAAQDAKRRMEEQVAQLGVREANLKQELTQLQAERDSLAHAVEPLARARYERLGKSKGENVVVGVQHGVCGGCHMKLPAQVLVQCQAQQELIACTNCGRILYFTPDMDLAVAD